MTQEDIAYLSNLADPIDESKAYAVGDLVLDDGVLSICASAGTGGGATFEPAPVSEVIKALSERVEALEDGGPGGGVSISDLAPDYDPLAVYENDDVVIKDGKLQTYVASSDTFVDTSLGAVLNKKMAGNSMQGGATLPLWPNQEELIAAVRAMYLAMGGAVSNA